MDVIIDDKNLVSWNTSEGLVQFAAALRVCEALHFEATDLVALLCSENGTAEIILYNLKGDELNTIKQPDGVYFQHLISPVYKGMDPMMVVCHVVTDKSWPEWTFSFNESDDFLKKLSPYK